ncbi:MAG TPA: tRNA lysidine(34) synthetase TilS [Aurantimonas sp.]|nr:tRNA lysidine(34) synthetase TilS [Aurantimonas sp.]
MLSLTDPAEAPSVLLETLATALTAGIDAAADRAGRSGPVILAVSGGPDSMALLLAAVEVRRRSPGGQTDFVVVTVDHGLRLAAAAEARAVAEVAEGRGLPHRTMRLAALLSGNVPAAARRGRYALLLEAARDAGASIIVTAHHEGDQFETHLLARARRAGPVGLAAMRKMRDLAPRVVLLRPFLEVPGVDLKALVAASGIEAVDDPTNKDERYERVRLRNRLSGSPSDHPRLRLAIARSRGERDALERAQAVFIGAAERAGELRFGDDGVLRVARAAFRRLDADTAFAFLVRALAAVSGGDYGPGAAQVLRLRAALAGPEGSVHATLGGVIVEADPDTILFLREFGRAGIEAVLPGDPDAMFDGRFLVGSPRQQNPKATRIAAFGAFGRGNRVEKTLPVLVGEAGLLAVPDALAHKAPADCLRLETTCLLAWRLLRDLPRRFSPAAPAVKGVASRFAAKAPGRVGKAGDTSYLRKNV